MSPPTPVAVVGPTGTGKSALAMDLAERLGGEIVNCDAMQLYRGMDVGTAKVPPSDRQGLPHHLFDVLDVTETASVAAYQRDAATAVEAIRARGAVPVIVGGSMLYVQGLLDGWEFPDTDPAVRARWESRLDEVGVAALHTELAEVDPDAAATILPTDPRRTVRALEVIELTGKPFAASRPVIDEPRWGTRILGLRCGLDELDARLEARTAAMFDGGLVEEVCSLLRLGLRDGVTARRAIGYAQVLDEMDGSAAAGIHSAESAPDASHGTVLSDAALERARERTFIGTRRYVRRQRSWFGRDHRIHWIDTDTGVEPPVEVALRRLGTEPVR